MSRSLFRPQKGARLPRVAAMRAGCWCPRVCPVRRGMAGRAVRVTVNRELADLVTPLNCAAEVAPIPQRP